MRKRRSVAVAAAVAGCAAVAALAAPSLFGADATGALANFTPGQVRLFHTGGSAPSAGYANLGRLTLPVGSWAILAHTVLRSQAPASTGIDCFLTAPGTTPQHTPLELLPTKGNNIKDLTVVSVTTAPNGGSADLVCRVSERTADRRVFAQDTSILAIAVTGQTVTHNPAPAAGT